MHTCVDQLYSICSYQYARPVRHEPLRKDDTPRHVAQAQVKTGSWLPDFQIFKRNPCTFQSKGFAVTCLLATWAPRLGVFSSASLISDREGMLLPKLAV